MDMAAYDGKGACLASTFPQDGEMRDFVREFKDSMADAQRMAGCHFFKVFLDEDLAYVLAVCSDSEEAYLVGRMAACQIRRVAGAYARQLDRNSFLLDVALGNVPPADLIRRAKSLKIGEARRVVFVIAVSGAADGIALETVQNMFAPNGPDFVAAEDEETIVLVKDAKDMGDGQALADRIVDNLRAEALVNARVGYGGLADSLREISRSYQEARMALDVGKVFYADRSVVSYGELGIGRLISQLPVDLCETFLHEVFGDHIPDSLDEETIVTIHTFFENNLNVSETARQLYVHRNTLVYRLERIEKSLGLDIRKFEDAMLFQIAWMVIAHVENAKRGD